MPIYHVIVTRSKTIWEIASRDVEANSNEEAVGILAADTPDNVEWFEDSGPHYDDLCFEAEVDEELIVLHKTMES